MCTARLQALTPCGTLSLVSRGIGKTQQRILDELAASQDKPLTVMDLAHHIDVSDRQVRRAVHALAGRGLVVLEKAPGRWAGIGCYGPLRNRATGYWDHDDDTAPRKDYGPDVPTAHKARHFYDTFTDDGRPTIGSYPIEYVHAGMPTGIALWVWLPHAHEERESRLAAFRAAIGRNPG